MDTSQQRPASIGIEVADSGTRLTATVGGGPTQAPARRWHSRLETPPTPEELTAGVAALAERVLREPASEGASDAAPTAAHPPLGVALWAGVDADRGLVRGMRFGSGWEVDPDGYPLAEVLAAAWGAPVALRSAPQAAALAEAKLGAGQGARLLLYVLQGRSLWDVLVADGQVVAGPGTPDGSLAHWRVGEGGPRCGCGATGHLEPLASAQSLVRNMIGQAAATDESIEAMLAASGGRAEAMSAAQVTRLAAAGESAAFAVVDVALDALACALANLCVALHPDRIVWGGPLAGVEEWLTPLRSRLAEQMPRGVVAPALVSAALEPSAALLGATLIARQ